VAAIAGILNIPVDELNEKLDAAWIREGLVVPVAELPVGDVETKDALLLVPGVRIDDKKGRVYPYGKAISEEGRFLGRLKGTDGKRIAITDASGNILITLIETPAVDGENVWLDISAE